jgi:hypothetical protein
MTNEEHVMQLFERANPVPEPDDIAPPTRTSGDLIDLQHRSSTMTLTTIEPDAPEQHHTKRNWLIAAAAAVALLIAGLVVAATRNDDTTLVPADPPAPIVEPDDAATPVEPAPDDAVEPVPDDAAEPAPDDAAEPSPDDAADPQPEDPATIGEQIPVFGETAEPGRYTTFVLGIDASFTTPRPLFVAANRASDVTLIDGYDGSYTPDTGLALAFSRWAGWSTREEAVNDTPVASIDPYDVDAWVADNDVTLLSDTTTTIAGRPARVFDVQVDPASTVQAATNGSGGCFAGWEPCFYDGTVASDYGQRTHWVSAQRITRYYLITVEGSEPLLISVGGPAGSEWFDEVESSVIATLELGPDAPPLG